jgi:aspartyl-tRNA synthetase
MIRTHTCGELRDKQIGEKVTLTGWVHSRRDFGGVIFIDLRDRYGLTQLTFNSEKNPEVCTIAGTLRHEWVIAVTGIVAARPATMINKEISTGSIEIEAAVLEVLSQSEVLPFEINNEETIDNVKEALRLEYRFLDLRRPRLQTMLEVKDKFFQHLRNYFHSHNFVDIQTPILANSSPEGARDFLIPSRLFPGTSYALPQAPQQFKQLLMVAGVDRYFQIAPCFRDEDTRNDRAYGEFYQLDMEMSFAGQDDVFAIMEPLMIELTEKFSSKKITNLEPDGTFRRLPWREAMEKYGIDKPDLRYDLSIIPITEIVTGSGFPGFDTTISQQGVVHALRVPKGGIMTRKVIDDLKALAMKKEIATFATLTVETDNQVKSSLAKFISEPMLKNIAKLAHAEEGDAVIMIAGPWQEVCQSFGQVRIEIARQFNLIDNNQAAWCWVVDFPMYEKSELKEGAIDFGHNPFTMPQGGHDAIDNKDPLEILAFQYDLILNGYEVSSGGVRNHDPELLKKAFIKAGYEPEEVDRRFGALMKAFRYGVPPHAGNAPGVDRLLMVLNDWDSIRDLYAFPKDGQGRDLMMNSPSEVDDHQLAELGLTHIKK